MKSSFAVYDPRLFNQTPTLHDILQARENLYTSFNIENVSIFQHFVSNLQHIDVSLGTSSFQCSPIASVNLSVMLAYANGFIVVRNRRAVQFFNGSLA